VADNFAAPNIFDNSYVKIRQITFSYLLPKRWLRRINEATVSLVAVNPFILYKNVPFIDPESSYNVSYGSGIEYGSLPTRRGFGFNIGLKF
jgi:hypothetical protein